MPLIETKGAASAQGFGLTLSSGPVNYIEDVFSTYLYTGNGSTQTITNGIDLSGKGGLVWSKSRSIVQDHSLIDTVRGNGSILYSNLTNAADTGVTTGITAFNTTGYALGSASFINQNTQTYASWTFREQPKFFDVVTFTSSASGNKTFSHNLGAVPGCVIIKNTQTSDPWLVYHRSVGDNAYLQLNSTAAQDPLTGAFSATSTTFTISSSLMYNSQTYVAYLFAHDAGGFGLSGTDNVISCGSYTGTGSVTGFDVNLGYEPQWVLVKRATGGTGNWTIVDNMRGFAVTAPNKGLTPNTSDAEYNINSTYPIIQPTATGFRIQDTTNADWNASSSTYIYIAIRRGPMKVPTSGTSVFSPVAYQGNADGTSGAQTISIGFPSDAYFQSSRTRIASTSYYQVCDRLRGYTKYLNTSATWDEGTFGSPTTYMTGFDNQTGMPLGKAAAWNWNGGGNSANAAHIVYALCRAPGFFDEVCYTGDDAANRNINHNLGVTPDLLIVKRRNSTGDWYVNTSTAIKELILNANYQGYTSTTQFGTNTSTTFNTGSAFSSTNTSGDTYVAYLFATCAGVSKVGSYTGTGALQTVDCGFTGGARFVLIKRTDSTGDWYVYDSARGISSGNDPYLLLNSTAAEVTGTNYVDTTSVGFQVTAAAPAGLNANGGTYIFLAIA